MSGKLKEVRERIKSVKSTQQITKAMKMVSAAKLRRAQDAIIQMRPYSEKLSGILNNILISQEGDLSMDLAVEREIRNVLIVEFTSDRGLCGAFNSGLNKKTLELIKGKYAGLNADQITILNIGKKGSQFFKKMGYNQDNSHMELMANISFEGTVAAAELVVEGFRNGDWDEVTLVYSQFRNAATQVMEAEHFLPLKSQEVDEEATEINAAGDFIFEPGKTDILKVLIPKILNTQFHKALLDTSASEHGARMTAMDKATENAEEMLKDLKISYNRARQAAITTELTEIVSGAAALEEG